MLARGEKLGQNRQISEIKFVSAISNSIAIDDIRGRAPSKAVSPGIWDGNLSTARAFMVILVDASDELSHFLFFFFVVGKILPFKLRCDFDNGSIMRWSVAAAK